MQRSPAKNAENQENTKEQAGPYICGLVSRRDDFALDFALKAAARSGG